MATKTTKKSKTAATRTAKQTTAKTGRTASKKTKCSCRKNCQMSSRHLYTFVALSLCFMITAMITAVLLIGAKVNNDALAKDIAADQAAAASAAAENAELETTEE